MTYHSKQIRIGTKCRRGIVGEKNPVIEGFKNLDVTSGSGNKIAGRQIKLDFSPMLIGPVTVGKQKAQKFENWWQGGKVYPDIGHVNSDDDVPTAKWYAFRQNVYTQEKGVRHPSCTKSSSIAFVDDKGHNHYKYHVPKFSLYDIGNGDQKLDYIEARKLAYVPIYAKLIRTSKSFKEMMKMVDRGEKLQILDLDGPRDGDLHGLKTHLITVDLLKNKINDKSAPFGHGYIVAALLAGIEPEEYTI